MIDQVMMEQVIYGIFMGQFIIDNLAFINPALMNELTIVFIQTLISTVVILVTAEFIPKVLFQIYSNISMKIFAIPASSYKIGKVSI